MTIEDELQQSIPFSKETLRAGVNLMYTAHWLETQLQNRIKPYGITIKQYNILRILRGASTDLSTLDIRSRMIDRSPDTSRLINRMVKNGLVVQRLNSLDKRLVKISITQKGRSLIDRLHSDFTPLQKELSPLSEQEAMQLNHLLDKIRSESNQELDH